MGVANRVIQELLSHTKPLGGRSSSSGKAMPSDSKQTSGSVADTDVPAATGSQQMTKGPVSGEENTPDSRIQMPSFDDFYAIEGESVKGQTRARKSAPTLKDADHEDVA